MSFIRTLSESTSAPARLVPRGNVAIAGPAQWTFVILEDAKKPGSSASKTLPFTTSRMTALQTFRGLGPSLI